jgi:hypothetical protein
VLPAFDSLEQRGSLHRRCLADELHQRTFSRGRDVRVGVDRCSVDLEMATPHGRPFPHGPGGNR